MKTAVITNHKLPIRQSSVTHTARKPKGISDDYLDFIKKVALTVIPYLDRNGVYRTEDLCNPIWDTTDPDEHKDIGTVISHLGVTDQLPLRRIRNATHMVNAIFPIAVPRRLTKGKPLSGQPGSHQFSGNILCNYITNPVDKNRDRYMLYTLLGETKSPRPQNTGPLGEHPASRSTPRL